MVTTGPPLEGCLPKGGFMLSEANLCVFAGFDLIDRSKARITSHGSFAQPPGQFRYEADNRCGRSRGSTGAEDCPMGQFDVQKGVPTLDCALNIKINARISGGTK